MQGALSPTRDGAPSLVLGARALCAAQMEILIATNVIIHFDLNFFFSFCKVYYVAAA